MSVPTGLEATVDHTVGPADTAAAVGSGDVDVLATPRLLALAEAATVAALVGHVADDRTTVGARVELDHLRPSPVGAVVRVHARLADTDGRRLHFDVTAAHGDGTEVARGRITRVIVARDRYFPRTDG